MATMSEPVTDFIFNAPAIPLIEQTKRLNIRGAAQLAPSPCTCVSLEPRWQVDERSAECLADCPWGWRGSGGCLHFCILCLDVHVWSSLLYRTFLHLFIYFILPQIPCRREDRSESWSAPSWGTAWTGVRDWTGGQVPWAVVQTSVHQMPLPRKSARGDPPPHSGCLPLVPIIQCFHFLYGSIYPVALLTNIIRQRKNYKYLWL